MIRALLCAIALLAFAPLGSAQEAPFPGRGTIEITVLFPAGSSADVTARLLADGIARQLGTNVIVDQPARRPGGTIGYRCDYRSKARWLFAGVEFQFDLDHALFRNIAADL